MYSELILDYVVHGNSAEQIIYVSIMHFIENKNILLFTLQCQIKD